MSWNVQLLQVCCFHHCSNFFTCLFSIYCRLQYDEVRRLSIRDAQLVAICRSLWNRLRYLRSIRRELLAVTFCDKSVSYTLQFWWLLSLLLGLTPPWSPVWITRIQLLKYKFGAQERWKNVGLIVSCRGPSQPARTWERSPAIIRSPGTAFPLTLTTARICYILYCWLLLRTPETQLSFVQ